MYRVLAQCVVPYCTVLLSTSIVPLRVPWWQKLLQWLRKVGDTKAFVATPPTQPRYESHEDTAARLMANEVETHYRALQGAALLEQAQKRGGWMAKAKLLKKESGVPRATNVYRGLGLEALPGMSLQSWTHWAHSQCKKLAELWGFDFTVASPSFPAEVAAEQEGPSNEDVLPFHEEASGRASREQVIAGEPGIAAEEQGGAGEGTAATEALGAAAATAGTPSVQPDGVPGSNPVKEQGKASPDEEAEGGGEDKSEDEEEGEEAEVNGEHEESEDGEEEGEEAEDGEEGANDKEESSTEPESTNLEEESQVVSRCEMS